MAKALILIDYTYDFVADDGRLTASKRAQAIETAIAKAARVAYSRGDYLFFAIDSHELGDHFHPETALFPPHNIIGSRGRTLYGELGLVYEDIKMDPRVFWMDKRHYSAFSGTDLDIRLRERGVRTLVLSGVLTDICVLHTAIDAYNLGYQIEIITSAVASLTDQGQDWALRHFKDVLNATLLP